VRDEKGKEDVQIARATCWTRWNLIDEYGADAVRFTLTGDAAMRARSKTVDRTIAGYRNFWHQTVERPTVSRDETACLKITSDALSYTSHTQVDTR